MLPMAMPGPLGWHLAGAGENRWCISSLCGCSTAGQDMAQLREG